MSKRVVGKITTLFYRLKVLWFHFYEKKKSFIKSEDLIFEYVRHICRMKWVIERTNVQRRLIIH
jgi:hypothetical protein